MECDTGLHALQFERQVAGLPRYVLAASSGTLSGEKLRGNGRIKRVTFSSQPPIDGCEILRPERPYDNPAVDIYTKKNRLVVLLLREHGTERRELRWRGGLIANVRFLELGDIPALGVEELNPDGGITRRVLYLDGRTHAFEYHPGPFKQERPQAEKVRASRV